MPDTSRTPHTSRGAGTPREPRVPRVPAIVEPSGAADWIAAARQPDRDPDAPRKRPQEYTRQETATRRAHVAQLLTWGYSAGRISRALNIPYTTVSDDVERIRTELQLDALPALQSRLRHSIAVYQQVQQSAWETYHGAANGSANQVSALNAVIAAQTRIDLLEGTTAPEKVNAAAIAEVQELVLQTLSEVGGAALQIAFVKALRTRTRAGMNRLLTSGHDVTDLEL